MKKISWILFCFSFSQTLIAAPDLNFDRGWTRISDPLIMSTTFNRELASLPIRGDVVDSHKYWSGDHWPRYKGGINYRWYSNRPRGFNLYSPTKQEAAEMTLSELSVLAPSEKWDLFIGRYDYPTKNEVNMYASPYSPTWEGICHGWSGAAMNHNEPESKTVSNPDGIKIPFGSADIKALLSWYYGQKNMGGYAHMGWRCNGETNGEDRCNHDMNAGSFHIVLSNKLGVEGKSFIADISRGIQVWNHLAYSFRSIVKNSNLAPLNSSAPDTVRMARMLTTISYVDVQRWNTWGPVLGTRRQRLINRTYEYYLDLDATGKIIGGEWISNDRPDFLWLEKEIKDFRGLFVRLPELLR